MKNYQKVNYGKYYTQDENGEYIQISRKDCFAAGEAPTAANPFKQRWFYDPEAGYAVRLARNEVGDAIGKRNASDLKSDERYLVRRIECVWKNTRHCDQACDSCIRQHRSRIIELDMLLSDDEGSLGLCFNLTDESAYLEALSDESELFSLLAAVLDKLTPDDRVLWSCLTNRDKKQDIAKRFNITVDGVRYRGQQLFKKLHSDRDLKAFFEN